MPKRLVQDAAAYIRTYSSQIEKQYQYLCKEPGAAPITVFSVQARALSVLVVTEGEDIRVNAVSDALAYVLPKNIREHVRVPRWS